MSRPLDSLLLAVGWVLLAFVLLQNVPMSSLSIILWTLAVSEVLSRLLVSGWEPTFKPIQESVNWLDALPLLLIRWILFVVFFLIVMNLSASPVIEGAATSIAYVIILTLFLGILRLEDICAKPAFQNMLWLRIYSIRMILLAGLGYIAIAFDQQSSELISMLAVMVNCGFLLISLTKANSRWHDEFEFRISKSLSDARECAKAVPTLIASNIDILLVPVLLEASMSVVYLLARGMAQLILMVLDHLELRLSPAIFSTYSTGRTNTFYQVCARANLAMLLIGGAVAIGLLAVAKYLQYTVVEFSDDHYLTLFWITLGASSRCIFGAIPVLLEVTGQRREGACISALSVFFFCLIATTGQILNAQNLAFLYSMTQLSHLGAAATLLALKSRIWPGLTALLCYQIRLR